MTTAGPFTIRELGGEARVVELVGRALPYRPLFMRTEQRVELTWLPGAPEATSTVLGAKEAPTTINGMWKEKYFDVAAIRTTVAQSDFAQISAGTSARASGDTPPFKLNNVGIASVSEAIDVIDSIVRQGQLLEMTWLTTRRVGHLVGFDKNWENFVDVAWAMDFVWIGRGEPIGAAVFSGGISQSDTVSTMQTEFSFIDAIRFPTNFGLTTDFVARYRDFVNNIGDFIFDMQNTIAQLTRKILSPVQVTRGLIATLRSIEEESTLIFDFFNFQVASNLNNTTPIGSQTYREKLDAERYRIANILWAKRMRRLSREHRDALIASLAGELAGTYVAGDFEDLRDVSRKFYRTPFEWRRIMIFNNLRNMELTAGQFILVPRFSPDETNQLVGGV